MRIDGPQITGSFNLNGDTVADLDTFATTSSFNNLTALIATTGSNLFKGTQTLSGSIIPAVNNIYDLGSPTHQFRHVYISTGSLYIDGTKVLGSTSSELQITTDTGQSFKILETGADTITLQSNDGNVTLTSTGGGDIVMDPSMGIIGLKGTVSIYTGNKIVSSDGNAIQFGNGIAITGSIIATGTNLISGSSQVLNGSGVWSGSAQLPSGIVSSSSQVIGYGFSTTGSNNFQGTQTITGSLFISSDLVVQGSSSLQNITASAVNIGANIINLNTANPAIRFAGLNIFDSGSIGGSGSFLYDAVQDEFIFIHRGDGTNITSSVVLMGPQTYNNIGNETYPTNNRILKGTGNEHVGDSIISETGGGIGIGGSLSVTGSGTFSGIIAANSTTTATNGSINIENLDPAIRFRVTNGTANNRIYEWRAVAAGGVNDIMQLRLWNDAQNSASTLFTIAPTAAATFLNTVNGTNFVSNITNNYGLVLNRPTTTNYNGISHQTNGSAQWFVGMRENGTNNYIIYNENGTDALTISRSNSNVGIRTATPYSPLTVTGAGISWGETVTYYPAPSGYITLAFRMEGSDTTTGTWAFGKQSTTENGGVQYLQIAKNGLTGGALHRSDAVQTWDPSNGNALFGYKVGIGTTNPGSKLTVSRDSESQSYQLELRNVGGISDSNYDGITFTQGSAGATPLGSIRMKYASNGYPGLGFYTRSSSSGETERLSISNSGHVTRPFQPAFLAYSENAGFTVTGGSWYNISNALTVEAYDIGSNYSGGRFTAPVAGRYLFYAGGWAQINANGERYAFTAQVNGSGFTFIGGGNYCITDSPLSGYSVVHNLAAGDYVDLLAFSAVTGTWGPGSHRVYWGGYLL